MTKLPEKIEDWTAPWEKEGASAFDASEAKKWCFNILRGQEREEEAHSATKAALETVKGENGELKAKVTALESDTSLDDIKRENAELKAAAEKANQNARKTMLDAVKAEFGLTDRQVNKLDGDDLEALRLDAKETFGEPSSESGSEKEGGESGTPPEGTPATQPRGRARNAGDPGQDDRAKAPSREEVLASIPD